MTEDAGSPTEPTPSDGADEPASAEGDDPAEPDAEPDEPDVEQDGAGRGETGSADGPEDESAGGADSVEESDDDSAVGADPDDGAEPHAGADSDDAGHDGGTDADGEGRIEAVDSPAEPEDDTREEPDADSEEPDADSEDPDAEEPDTDTEDPNAEEPDTDTEDPNAEEPDTDTEGQDDDGSGDEGEEDADDEGTEDENTSDEAEDAEERDEPGDADDELDGETDGELAEDDEDEELTTAEKGMQTVEKVGNAFAGEVEGPESDKEMPLTAHIEEMMRRLAAVFAVAGIVSGAVLFVGSVSPAVPSAAELIRYFWDFHVGLPSTPGGPDGHSPYVYGPLEYLLTKLKVVALAGLLAGLPVFVYQTYGFMRPGLYPHERRYYLAAIPTSLVLGVVGAAFAHFAVLPFIFDYFISYTVGTAELRFGLKETFNLILIMMGYFAIVFQIPLFIQLAIMMGVVTRQWLEDRRLIFWGAFLGLALTFITVDPTGFAPIIVVATMIVLFEGTLALLRWTGN